ncbi:MAG: pyridoxal phosphate-dependent aminotransferase [Oscillospiraceae bacterium]|nr:pyridoxal phosphate-dependent aminotransferase [Oscillospiraceae bacterium]MBR7010900.1 pyridoxal phosphate-dependent aminotransferase [Oscillospiraceae bacterium]
MKLSQKAQRCTLSPMRKFTPYAMAAEAAGKKIYKLNIGQPDIETPPAFFEAVRGFSQKVLAYANSPGAGFMRDAVVDYYHRIGVDYTRDDVLITTGGSEALQILFLCILDEGSEVIVPEPFYSNYTTFIQAAGGVIRPLSTVPEEDYSYAKPALLESLINEKTRAIAIINPQNPTGNVLTREELRAVADVAKKHDLYLICDEVYREFVYDTDDVLCAGSLRDLDDNVVIIDSVSKRFSACGARIGMLISRNKALMAEALKFCQGRLCAATLDQVGAAALYSVGPDYFEKVRAEYRRRRDLCYQKLTAIPGVVCAKPMGAFYAMAKLPIDDADEFTKWMLTDFDDHGETVMCSPANGFYATPGKGKNEVRIAYVLKERDLGRALDLLALGIERYNNR